MRDDPTLPLVFTRADALAAGMSRHQIGQRVRTRTWRPLRRAVYVSEQRYAALSLRDQHTTSVLATLMARGAGVAGGESRVAGGEGGFDAGESRVAGGEGGFDAGESRVAGGEGGVVASHLSAAVGYGWVLPLSGTGPVTITDGNLDSSTRQVSRQGPEDDVTVQVASLPACDVSTRSVEIAGSRWAFRTTSRARTVADNLRHLANPDGVALADSALRTTRVSYEQVAAVLDRQACWPYAERGRRALPMVDPRRESWLESFSFVTLDRLGLPMPEPQVSLFDAKGRFVGRVDGWLEDEAVALESDGRAKYFLGGPRLSADGGFSAGGRLSADVELAADELMDVARRRMFKEKERRDRIVDLGAELVQWGTAEIVRSPLEVVARIAAARRRGDAGRFRGRTAYLPAPPWLMPARRRVG